VSKMLKAHYVDIDSFTRHEVKISDEDFFLVMKLRKMSEKKMRKLFEYIGGKAMLKISLNSNHLVIEGFRTEWKNFKVIV